jgi:Zn-dependent protease with chaperone function
VSTIDDARTGGFADRSAGDTCANCGFGIAAGLTACPRCGAHRLAWPAPRSSDIINEPRGSFDHRPARFPSTAAWLADGLLHNVRSILAAILVTWFNVPIAVFLAVGGTVLGAVSGVLTGFVSPLFLPFAGEVADRFTVQTGAVIGGLVGAVFGFFAGVNLGLFGAWLLATDLDPLEGLFLALAQILLAVLVGTAYTLYYVFFEGWRLRATGVRRLSRRESDLLLPILDETVRRLGLANGPRLMINDTREANAFAHGRHIVITTGFLEDFAYDREAIAAVLSHELTHWNSGDAVSSIFVRGVALPLYLIYNAASAIMRGIQHPIVQLLAWLIAWPVLFTIRFIFVPLQAKDSRSAEYRADQGAALAGHLKGMRTILTRFRETTDDSRNGWDAAIGASHPPHELRLERLEEPGVKYTLPDEAVADQSTRATTSSLSRD